MTILDHLSKDIEQSLSEATAEFKSRIAAIIKIVEDAISKENKLIEVKLAEIAKKEETIRQDRKILESDRKFVLERESAVEKNKELTASLEATLNIQIKVYNDKLASLARDSIDFTKRTNELKKEYRRLKDYEAQLGVREKVVSNLEKKLTRKQKEESE